MVKTQDWANAQTSVIGSALIDPRCVPVVMDNLCADDFEGSARTIFEAIFNLKVRGQPIDPVAVLNIVGAEYRDELVRCMDETATAANVELYIDVCQEQSRLRKLNSLAIELTGTVSLEDAIATLQKMNDAVTIRSDRKTVGMSAALEAFFEEHQKGRKDYISFGLGKMDKHLTVDLGDVVVLGGYPSDGKSAMMLQWAWHLGKTYRVGVFSYETSTSKMMDRLVSHAAGLDFEAVKHSDMDARQWSDITKLLPEFQNRKIELIEAAGMTAGDIIGKTISRGYQVVMIDYVQLVSPDVRRHGGTRTEEVAEISKTLHVLAQRHKVLVVELSQLRRPDKPTGGKKTLAPTLSSLRESGQLEQDADVVALLYKTEPEKPDSKREMYIAKNKEGTTGRIAMKFDGRHQTFLEDGGIDPRQIAELERMRKARIERERSEE